MRGPELDRAAPDPAACKAMVVATYVTAAAYQSVALPGEFPRLLESLTRGPAPVILVALGTPYVWRSYPEVAAFLTAYSSSELSEAAAVRALFGEIAVGGRSPVSIPPLAKAGDGIPRAARMTK
jgi:beta-N-acetylhexosaminidase